MIETKGTSEDFAGSIPSNSPTVQKSGVFSLCSGGVPIRGAFGRLPGKTLRYTGLENGAAISMYQLGSKLVIQRFTGIEIVDLLGVLPVDYVFDNEGHLIYDSQGIPLTQ